MNGEFGLLIIIIIIAAAWERKNIWVGAQVCYKTGGNAKPLFFSKIISPSLG